MPDWLRIFPDAAHRWTMGLRGGELADFFRTRDPTGAVLRERARWLTEEPAKYVVASPSIAACVDDTIATARSIAVVADMPLDAKLSAPDVVERAKALGRTWEPDVVWLLPDDEGVHHVVGGVVCFPSSWALTDKIGLPMSRVHEPVPNLNETLGRQIDRFLEKLAPNDVWTRENWSLSRSDERNQHTSRPRAALDAAVPAEEAWIRLEHQLLLRLPGGGVLFGIRIELAPLVELRRDAEAARRLAQLVATMTPEAAAYKNFAAARDRLVALLRS